jgi:hypothetical protein
MGATSHRPVPFFRANLVPRATLASHVSRAHLVRLNKVADYAGNTCIIRPTHSATGGRARRAKRDGRRRRSPAAVSSRTISRDDTGWAPSASATA